MKKFIYGKAFCVKGLKMILFRSFLLLLFSGATLAPARGATYQQTTKISVTVKNSPIPEFFRMIEKQSEYLFNFVNEDVKDIRITVNLKDTTINAVLDAALKNTGLAYSVNDRHVTVFKAQQAAKTPAADNQRQLIKGNVRDGSGQPLPGVTVIVDGTTLGTTTESNGDFSLRNPGKNATLVLSYIGYTTQRVEVGSKTFFQVVMDEETQSLDQVVVIGYGSARKKDLTGAITRVVVNEKQEVPNVNALQMLNGVVPGLRIVDTGRAGAESASIEIRGTTSIDASNSPLIVLDGVPYAGYLSDISTNDIETMDILKDASSTAIYGSRGANGVIMITTKKGTSETPRLNYKGYFGYSDFAHTPKLMGPDKYVQLRKDAEAYKGASIPFSQIELENMEAGRTIDAWDVIKRTAPITEHELSVSGKGKKMNYYISTSYTNQKSPIIGDDFERLTVRANFSVDIASWLTIGTNTGFTFRTQAGEIASWGSAAWLSPYSSIRYPDGELRRLPYGDTMVTNPLWGTEMNESDKLQYNLSSNNFAEVRFPIKGLTYRLNVATNLRFTENKLYKPAYERDGYSWLGEGSKEHIRSNYLLMEHILKFERTFNKHSVDVTLMYGFDKTDGNSSKLENSDIFNDALGYDGLNLGLNPAISTSANQLRSISSMARAGYRYDDRYMVMFTIRRDGFSAFGPGRKYGLFPSVGASWVVSQEKFMQNAKWLDLLKLRLSWGKNGNRAVTYSNNYLSGMYTLYYVFGETQVTGVYPGKMENPDLGWETSASWNLGIDFSAFNGRLNATIDAYNTKTTDLLLKLKIPNMSGYTEFLTNIGETNNKGVEIGLNTKNIIYKDFSWETGVTFSLNRNKIVHLTGQDLDGDGREDDDISSGLFIGHSMGSNFDYVFDGIWQEGDDFSLMPTAKPGDIRFKDLDGGGSIGPEDRKVQHNNRPSFVMGISNTFRYRGLSLSFMLDWRQGGYASNSWLNIGKNFYDRANQLDIPYWTPEQPRSDYPAVGYSNPLSWGFYEKLSYVRLSDITLSYDLPQKWMRKIRFHNARVYLSGKNLATWTDWHGWDPEHAKGGRGAAYGPLMRTWVFGLQFGL